MKREVSWSRLRQFTPLYLFVLPSFLLVAIFAYYPVANAIYHSTFRWNGDYVNEFIGMANFNKALGIPAYWIVLLVLAFLFLFSTSKQSLWARVVKFSTGVLLPVGVSVVLPFLRRTSIGDPNYGQLAVFAVFWGLLLAGIFWRVEPGMGFRERRFVLIGTMAAGSLLLAAGIDMNIAWTVPVAVAGVLLWAVPSWRRDSGMDRLRVGQGLAALAVTLWALARHCGGDAILWSGFIVIVVLVLANLVKMLPSIATAVVIHRLKSETANYWYRVLFVIPMIIPGMVYLLLWKFFFEPDGLFNLILRKTGIMHLLYLYDAWTGGGAFVKPEALDAGTGIGEVLHMASQATPSWLGSPELVLPAFILWGFPWVGAVGVLIYLAGLQNIDQALYEAAELDGAGPLQKFLHIELPLILTQVRINLVLMIIGTLQMYGMILILYGDGGGPNGRMMVPGLYMFRSAFVEGYAGYACAIGLILFFLILVLTEINNRFIRVDR